MADTRQGRSPRSAVVPRHQNMVGVGLGDSRRNGTNPRFRHQFHADSGGTVSIFQVENKLGQIFNRVNIVVRRRRDQTNPGCTVPGTSNPVIYFEAGQLPTFAGLGPLRHLDLQFTGIAQVMARDPKPARCHLFDRRIHIIAVGQWRESLLVFAPLARITFAANTIHSNGQSCVGFPRN